MQLGPALANLLERRALSFAPSSKLWTAVTLGFSITERDAVESASHGAFSARAIVGIEL